MAIKDLKAALDQVQAALRDIAPIIFTHYASLVKAGFDGEQAFILTRDFHARYFYPVEFQEEDDTFGDD